MIRHLLKLVWNRKRANALLILEIFFSFLVVLVVATGALYFWSNWRRPLGFSYQDVWNVSIDVKQTTDDTSTPEQRERFARLLREVESLGPVEAAAGTMIAPFEFGSSVNGFEVDGRRVESPLTEATLGLDRVLGLEIVRGRWFEPGDEALDWRPVLIDEDLARSAFGGEDPVGKVLQRGDPETGSPDRRVVGVVSDFRIAGELSGRENFYFDLVRLGRDDRPPRNLLLKLRPGTSAAFEEELTARLQGIAPDWSFEVKPLDVLRESRLRFALAPLAAGSLVAFFLLLMVGLGLVGVLWQNLLRRTREIGLRRATGASRGAVYRQVLMEQLLVTGLGVLLGTILAVQLPIAGIVSFLPGGVFAAGLAAAAGAIFLLSAACALYPSALASRVHPSEALRYE